ncbi:MAG: phospholipid carrier-dependent glycosyltransferase [Chloroflexota bacterium]
MVTKPHPPRHRRAIGLAAILALFVILGIVYSTVVPIFEKPDELHHFFVVQYIRENGALPVQSGSGETLWAQEASQPPLYYALAALATGWIDTSDARELVWLNPQRNLGDPRDPGNKNLSIHTHRERWPYRGATLAVHVARWLALVFGAGTVLGSYAITRQVFPARPGLALAAAAINAFIPQFLFISTSASNDSLIAFLATLTLLVLIRMLDGRANTLRRHLSLGLLLGLAALTKLSGLALLGLSGGVIAWLAWRRRSWRYLLLNGWIVAGAAAAIAGWWYARNLALYGDFTGLSAMLQVVGRRTDFAASVGALWGEFAGVRASFWGLFGWFNLPLPDAVYRTLDGLSLLAAAGWGLWLLRQWRAGKKTAQQTKLNLGLLLLWAAITFALLVRWTATTPGSQGRLLFPAMSALALALAVGWSAWLPHRWRDAAPLMVGAGLLVLSALLPARLIAPAYARPPLLAPDTLPVDLPRLEVTFGRVIRLHGCELAQQKLRPGETLAVTCYWQALEPLEQDYFFYHHLLGRELAPVGKEHGYPGSGSFPTSLWPVGQVVAATEWLRLGDEIAAPTLGRLAVGVYQPETEAHLPPANPQGQPLGLVIGGQVKIAAPPGQTTEITYPLRVNVDSLAELIGYDVQPAAVAPDKVLSVTLYWKATVTAAEDYTVFVHLLDAAGIMRGQGDGPPLNGDYPTSLWEPGEVIADTHRVAVQPDAPPGHYRLAVGFYRPADDTRLPLTDAGGARLPEDRALLPAEMPVSPAP